MNDNNQQNREKSDLEKEIELLDSEIGSSDDSVYKENVESEEIPEAKIDVEEEGKILKSAHILNDSVESIVKGTPNFFFRTWLGRVILMIGVLAIVSIIMLFSIIGLDQYVINSSIEGRVLSTDNKPIQDAEVKIQSRTVKTDSQGNFKFSNIDYGGWKIEISANGFEKYEENINIKRFSNKGDFRLVALDQGFIKGKFETDNELNLKNIEVKFDKKIIEVRVDGSFETELLSVGQYTLTVTSPFYKDIEKNIKVENGLTNLDPIKLEEAGDIVFNLKEFKTGEDIGSYDVEYSPKIGILNKDKSKVKIKDITPGIELAIIIDSPNFNDKKISQEIKNGETNLEDVYLVDDTRIIIRSDNKLYSSYLDGGNMKLICSDSANGLLASNNQFKYIKCGSTIKRIDLKENSESILLEGVNDTSAFDPELGLFNSSFDGSATTVEWNDFSEKRIIFSIDKEVISILPDANHDKVFISTTENIYQVTLDFRLEVKPLTFGFFKLEDITTDGRYILAQSFTTADRTNASIWMFDIETTDKFKKEINGIFSKVGLYTNDKAFTCDSTRCQFYNISTSQRDFSLETNGEFIIDEANSTLITSNSGDIFFKDFAKINRKIGQINSDAGKFVDIYGNEAEIK